MAVSFGDALTCATFAGAAPAIQFDLDTISCVLAFSLCEDELANDFPGLRRLHHGSDKKKTEGQLAIEVLKFGPGPDLSGIVVWARKIAPKGWTLAVVDGKTDPKFRRAAGLYSDCYLALDAWVTSWNRRQIKRVA